MYPITFRTVGCHLIEQIEKHVVEFLRSDSSNWVNTSYSLLFDRRLASAPNTIEVVKITEIKLVFKNKREMSLDLSNHRCSPNWYVAPILMNDCLVPR
jgi:hypothetical protein